MDQIQYIGETLWPAYLGKFLIILAFVASGLAAVSYAYATNKSGSLAETMWKKMGRISFSIHGISIITVILLIFYVMINQMYEYQYVQAHVSDDLPMKYIFSAFWEGQEGSFLLWMFWHIILSVVIMMKKGKWEAPVLSLMSLIQLIICSMILGLYFNFGDIEFKIGSNPILLLRDVIEAPIFANADYVNLIKGTGLNPLLQNYWMTIHPPTLFIGFASTAFPFCFAVAGLWTKDYEGWLKPSLRWALFSGFMLGTGVLMGAAWAYEALTFGGYWAWDPVENMSLVPWLILIAGIHTHLVANATKYSIKSTVIFYILTFVLILYSTFLTRSGVLGDTSAHAFTEMGLEWQLVILIACFTFIGIYFLVKSWKHIPAPEKEEKMASREFWMFIGSLVLFFSGILISSSTSLPVFNKIRNYFDPEYIGLVINDPIDHYNRYQLWIAVFISLISGLAILMRYNEINWDKRKTKYFKIIGSSLLAAVVLDLLFAQWIDVNAWQYHLLSITSLFIVICNLYYLISIMKLNIKASGSVLSHIGFGLFIIGVMASGLSKRYISSNPFAQSGLLDEELVKTSIILIKDKPMYMNNYWVEYQSDTIVDKLRSFNIHFKKVDDKNEVLDEFTLYPTSQMSNDFSKVAAFNPSIKNNLFADIFIAVRSLPRPQMDVKFAREMEDTLKFTQHDIQIGDTINSKEYSIQLLNIRSGTSNIDSVANGEGLSIFADVRVEDKVADTVYLKSPSLMLEGLLVYSIFEEIPPLNMRVRVNESFFNDYYTQDDQLDYKDYKLKEGETKLIGDYNVSLTGFDREVKHPNYQAEQGDIAIAANLDFIKIGDENSIGKTFTTKPIYIIRDSRPFSIKDYLFEEGIHVRLKQIDPSKGEFTFALAIDDKSYESVPIEVATNVPRSDLIVLEAIEFPGINFVWLGTILMMIGLLVSLIYRSRQKQRV
jgi:cytochrome c-type biogenesis protein CcmF